MTAVSDLQCILDRSPEELRESAREGRLGFLDGAAAEDRLFLRVARRLVGALNDERVRSDFVVLLRQAQQRALAAGGRTASDLATAAVRIPERFLGLDGAALARFGLRSQYIGQGQVRITPESWTSSWLDEGSGDCLLAACAEEPRRRLRQVVADPVVGRLRPALTKYSSEGQREAVRAAFLSPAGSTTLVNLPTGSGKSLAFQIPALVAAKKRDGMVVVVVPTVALALDQASRFKEFASSAGVRSLPSVSLAYHGGLTEDEKRELKSAIRNGRTPVLFTSPEACVGGLGFSLRSAAKAGGIRVFVIDEAHTVASWGDGFRPAFQALSGFRNQLLEIQRGYSADRAFRTLLLSATLTGEAIGTLRRLFGHDGDPAQGGETGRKLEVVAEAALRPEPSYLVTSEMRPQERQQLVLEAVHHFPRPLLLYVTTPDDARKWHRRLLGQGFFRVSSVVGGDMSKKRGREVLRGWSDGDLDIVVATSAFGLGVDQSDVRSVIHACVPESVDRFYQEVGRAGRDGNSCISLLAWTAEDVRVAEGLARETEISAERGFERWRAMRADRPESFPGDVHGVRLTAMPAGLTISTERNRSWNFKTLLRMAGVGFIEFAGIPDPDEATSERMDESEWEERRSLVGVRIIHGDHDELETWQDEFESHREMGLARREATIVEFKRLIESKVGLHDLFRATYSVPEYGIRVAASAGDCPVTRREGRVSHENPAPMAVVPDNIAAACSKRLDSLFRTQVRGAGPLWIGYLAEASSRGWTRKFRGEVQRLFERLSSEGVVSFGVPENYLRPKDWEALAARSPWGFVLRNSDVSDDPLSNQSLPTVTLLLPECSEEEVRAAAFLERDRHLIIVPQGAPHPTYPGRLAKDLRQVRMSSITRELDS